MNATTPIISPELASEPQLPAVAEPQVRELKRTEPVAAPRIYPPKIAKAILAVTRDIGRITKNGENEFQHYKYPKWDDIVERLSPLLTEHGLITVQTEKTRHLIEQNDKGSMLSIVYGFSFANEDGDAWPEIEWTALARLRDQKGISDDKAAAKCHTQAEKYFCIKQFKIRTAEAIDSDADGPQHRTSTLPKKNCRDLYERLQSEIDGMTADAALVQWGSDAAARIAVLPVDWVEILRCRFAEKLAALCQHHDADGVVWEDDGERPAKTDDAPSGHGRNGDFERFDGVPVFVGKPDQKVPARIQRNLDRLNPKPGSIAERAIEARQFGHRSRGPSQPFIATREGPRSLPPLDEAAKALNRCLHPMNDELPGDLGRPKLDQTERDGVPAFLDRRRQGDATEPTFVDLVTGGGR